MNVSFFDEPTVIALRRREDALFERLTVPDQDDT